MTLCPFKNKIYCNNGMPSEISDEEPIYLLSDVLAGRIKEEPSKHYDRCEASYHYSDDYENENINACEICNEISFRKFGIEDKIPCSNNKYCRCPYSGCLLIRKLKPISDLLDEAKSLGIKIDCKNEVD
jgi:hypothetical protein